MSEAPASAISAAIGATADALNNRRCSRRRISNAGDEPPCELVERAAYRPCSMSICVRWRNFRKDMDHNLRRHPSSGRVTKPPAWRCTHSSKVTSCIGRICRWGERCRFIGIRVFRQNASNARSLRVSLIVSVAGITRSAEIGAVIAHADVSRRVVMLSRLMLNRAVRELARSFAAKWIWIENASAG